MKVSIASLDAGRDLSDAEIGSTICLDEIHDFYCSDPVLLKDVLKRPAIRLLPPGMKTARLALAAVILLGQFPATVVKIGIGAAGQGVMSLSQNEAAFLLMRFLVALPIGALCVGYPG